MAKKIIYIVTDVETCTPSDYGRFAGLVFDVAWKAIDKQGKVYGQASYACTDVLSLERPYFWEKVGQYFEHCYEKKIEPVSFAVIRNAYNKLVQDLVDQGFRVIFCAYNAPFDCGALQYTSMKLLGVKFLLLPIEIVDIWHAWSLSCPMNYMAPTTASGKYLSTSAQSVWAFESKDKEFIEAHIAYSDVEIETEILLKVLRRRKQIRIVNRVKELAGSVYRVANKRLGIDGRTVLSHHVTA